jgi:hypothetical protein
VQVNPYVGAYNVGKYIGGVSYVDRPVRLNFADTTPCKAFHIDADAPIP